MTLPPLLSCFFFFNDPAPTEIYPLSLHAALPIYGGGGTADRFARSHAGVAEPVGRGVDRRPHGQSMSPALRQLQLPFDVPPRAEIAGRLRQLQLAGGLLSYHLVRAKRRTIALFVDGDGIEARAPRHFAIADIETFIREKERWIRKRLPQPRRRPLVWEAGARLPWLRGPRGL